MNKYLGFIQLGGVYVLGIVLTIGCGQGASMAPVSGVVKLDGEPLADAGVTFTPVSGGRPAWATTDQQGQYTLTTFVNADGALVGEHVITVAKAGPAAPIQEVADQGLASIAGIQAEMKKPKRALVPAKYGGLKTTDLRYVVETVDRNVADFDLSSGS